MEGPEKTPLMIPIEKKLFLFTAIVIFKFLRIMRHTYLQMYGMHF